MSFPQGFFWGTATSSYQIEGGAFEDGMGQSVWDMLCRKPGAIWNGQNGNVASDHYHRWKEDVALMKSLGLNSYRFSLAWPRILPEGLGEVNAKGLDFYDKLVDELLASGIEPFVTLFHWDYPLPLYHKGGWLNPDSPKWFQDYTDVVVKKLGDRVQYWMTHNEPACFIGLGLQVGIHAPGDKLAELEVMHALHHTLVSHGLACQSIRAHATKPPKIGLAHVGHVTYPHTETPEDIEAARAVMFAHRPGTLFNNPIWLEPWFNGKHQEDVLAAHGHQFPKGWENDLETIHQPLDFFGLNVYSGEPIRAGENGPEVVAKPTGHALTAFRWPVTPECLYWGPRFFAEKYGKPILITENGLSNIDWPSVDGKVHDPQRIDFTQRHLREYKRAVADGVPAMGYLHWSFLDNFEWAEGYKERFGLVYVDFETGERIPKDSALWYGEVARTGGANL